MKVPLSGTPFQAEPRRHPGQTGLQHSRKWVPRVQEPGLASSLGSHHPALVGAVFTMIHGGTSISSSWSSLALCGTSQQDREEEGVGILKSSGGQLCVDKEELESQSQLGGLP